MTTARKVASRCRASLPFEYVVLQAVLLIAGIVLSITYNTIEPTYYFHVWLAFISIMLWALSIWMMRSKYKIGLLHPLVLIGGNLVLIEVGGHLFNSHVLQIFAALELNPARLYLLGDERDYFRSMHLLAIATFGVLAGTLIFPRNSTGGSDIPSQSTQSWAQSMSIRQYAFIFPVAAVISQAEIVPVGPRQYLYLIGEWTQISWIIAGAMIAIRPSVSRKWLVFFFTSISCLLLTGMRDGQRGPIVRPFLAFAVGYCLWKGRHRAALLVTMLCCLGFVLPILNSIKSDVSAGLEFNGSVARAAKTGQNDGSSVMQSVFETLSIRVFFVGTHLAQYSGLWPDVNPYEKGSTLLWAVESMLPRIVVPDKENVMIKYNRLAYSAGLLADEDAHGEGTSAALDGFSEYYINFGPWGLLALSVLHGAYYRFVYYLCCERNRSIAWSAICLLLCFLHSPDLSVVRLINGDSRVVLIAVAIFLATNSHAKLMSKTERGAVAPA